VLWRPRITPLRYDFIGLPLDPLKLDETVTAVETLVDARTPGQHCVLNASKVVLAQQDDRLRRIIRECALVNADGQSVVWAARLLGHHVPERVPGIDLMQELLTLAERRSYRVFFYGARQEVLDRMLPRLRARYPRLHVAGASHGYVPLSEQGALISRIRESEADLLFVGISSPQKEYWLAEHMARLNVPFAMGVGGSFDVLAGVTRRAPGWMQKAGLEWFFRFAQEPRRMWRRYLLGNLRFGVLVAREIMANRRRTRE
jgi:N-acetylglucosaminyldiphosphoundecaprenol N-acetyl-beta-D-mannosaminyltransferase